MQKRKNKENEDEEDKEKVCVFHLILHGFFDLVCFARTEVGLGVRRVEVYTQKQHLL